MSKLSSVLPTCLVGPWFSPGNGSFQELAAQGENRAEEITAGVRSACRDCLGLRARPALGACLSDANFARAKARN